MDDILIGRLMGIEIRASRSWAFVVVLVAVTVALQFQQSHPDWANVTTIIAGCATSALLFASVVAHEMAHCIVARRFGIQARSISLNFFGGLSWLSRPALRPVEEFAYSIAGPAANAVLAAVFFAVSWAATGTLEPVGAVSTRVAALNVLLAVFNLLPGFPLDGGRVIRAAVWRVTGSYERGTAVASFAGQAIAILVVMIGIAIALGGDFSGLFIAVIGYYLFTRARASMGEVVLRRALHGLTVQSLWLETLPQIARQATVGEFIRELTPDGTAVDPHYMVVDGGIIWGVVPASRALLADPGEWDTLHVSDLMTPIDKLEKLSYDTEIVRAMEAIYASGANELPVVSDNVVQGFVGRDALLRFVASRVSMDTGQAT
ncbi:MAG TPA: site-2 protease family protein [Blastocatellia bacterium]|nr:site-2 protease family protein [Blastocatellia bacterium]